MNEFCGADWIVLISTYTKQCHSRVPTDVIPALRLMSFPRSDAGIPFAGEIAGSSPAMT